MKARTVGTRASLVTLNLRYIRTEKEKQNIRGLQSIDYRMSEKQAAYERPYFVLCAREWWHSPIGAAARSSAPIYLKINLKITEKTEKLKRGATAL